MHRYPWSSKKHRISFPGAQLCLSLTWGGKNRSKWLLILEKVIYDFWIRKNLKSTGTIIPGYWKNSKKKESRMLPSLVIGITIWEWSNCLWDMRIKHWNILNNPLYCLKNQEIKRKQAIFLVYLVWLTAISGRSKRPSNIMIRRWWSQGKSGIGKEKELTSKIWGWHIATWGRSKKQSNCIRKRLPSKGNMGVGAEKKFALETWGMHTAIRGR